MKRRLPTEVGRSTTLPIRMGTDEYGVRLRKPIPESDFPGSARSKVNNCRSRRPPGLETAELRLYILPGTNGAKGETMANATFGMIGGAILAILLFGWWGVFVVALWALAAWAECRYPSGNPKRESRFAVVFFAKQKRK